MCVDLAAEARIPVLERTCTRRPLRHEGPGQLGHPVAEHGGGHDGGSRRQHAAAGGTD